MFPDLSLEDTVALDSETDGLTSTSRAVGLGYYTGSGRRGYFAWGHLSGNNCTSNDVHLWAKRNLGPGIRKVFHNATFDIRMLYRAGIDLDMSNIEDTGIISPLLDELEPSFRLDDLGLKHLGMGKLEDEELNTWCSVAFGGKPTTKAQVQNYWRCPGDMVAPYCIRDCELTLALFRQLHPLLWTEDVDGYSLNDVYWLETALIPVLVRMNRVGVRVDVERAHEVQRWLDERLRLRMIEWNAMTSGVNVKSSKQMAELLEGLGIQVPVLEPTPAMKKKAALANVEAVGNPSVKGAWLEHLQHPVGALAKEIRTLQHYSGTFVNNYILDNVDEAGMIHGEFHALKKEREGGGATGTVSGRLASSGGLNLQNFPAPDPDEKKRAKNEMAVAIRGLFVPLDSDMRWASIDYSQIEYRFFAHYAGGMVKKQYIDDPTIDFHDMVAKITGIGRKSAKNMNFGMLYGMGQKLMAERLNVPLEEAQRMLKQYHGRLPEVKQIYQAAIRRATKRGYIRTWGNRRRRFELDPQGRYGPYKGTHKALNALLQGSAADLIKRAMVDVDAYLLNSGDGVLQLSVHDELCGSFDKGAEGRRALADVKDIMQQYRISVPILVDCEVGPNWGEVSEWDGN